jgi:Kef-type K+ transport system membrane component KefB
LGNYSFIKGNGKNGDSFRMALVLVSLGATFLPSLSIRLRLPSVVLEILFGVLIGKSLLNLQFGGQWLSFLGPIWAF